MTHCADSTSDKENNKIISKEMAACFLGLYESVQSPILMYVVTLEKNCM